MSGGVDSSVAAALLAAEGHEVVGLTMNLWPDWLPEPDDAFKACCGVSAIEDARAVAHRLDIRHYVLNMREEFERAVIGYFAGEYAHGRTPNPCIACNQAIKFSLLLHKVTALGLDGVVTGHDSIQPQRRHFVQQEGELDGLIARNTGIGCTPMGILAGEVADDGAFKLFPH